MDAFQIVMGLLGVGMTMFVIWLVAMASTNGMAFTAAKFRIAKFIKNPTKEEEYRVYEWVRKPMWHSPYGRRGKWNFLVVCKSHTEAEKVVHGAAVKEYQTENTYYRADGRKKRETYM